MSLSASPKTFGIVGVVLAGLAGGAWGVVHFSGREPIETGPAIPDEYSVEKMRAALKEQPGPQWDKVREFWERQDLSDEQREKIWENWRQVQDEQEDAKMNEYFSATPEEREKILDREIDEREARRKEMEAQWAKDEAVRESRREEDEKTREKRREEWAKRMGGQTQAERKTRSESRDPDKRAQRNAFRDAMHSRMAARGIEPPRGGRWGGRGPGGPGGGGPRRGPGG